MLVLVDSNNLKDVFDTGNVDLGFLWRQIEELKENLQATECFLYMDSELETFFIRMRYGTGSQAGVIDISL